jgi:hypothetical protein
MGNFLQAISRGYSAIANANGPDRFAVEDKPVRCPHCSNETFVEGEVLLNTVGMTFFGLAWANKTASTLLCAECDRIEWFAQKPVRR